jgi:AAA15 family ATPase/GTPase
MIITKLSLTNFRSFKETQTIEFAPVTLLFGPNSVGKSTVLMALFYLQQILSKGQCDPASIDALGGKFVGGFKNLVNGKDINKNIKLKVEYDKGNAIGSTYTYLSDLIGEQVNIALNSPSSEAKKIAVEFEISWSISQKAAFISNYKVWFDEIEIVEINSDTGLKQPMITALNYLHPLLLPEGHDDWLVDCFDNQVEIHNDLFDKVLELKGIYNPGHAEIADGETPALENDEDASVFTDSCYVSEFHELLNASRIPFQEFNNSNFMSLMDNSTLLHAPIGIKGAVGALPVIGQPIKSSLSMDDEKLNAVIGEILSDVIVAPLDNLLALLNDSLCIGPLRHIPDENYQENPYPSQADWYDGKACWDTLVQPKSSRDIAINNWLMDSDKLNLGYKLVNQIDSVDSLYFSPHVVELSNASKDEFTEIKTVKNAKLALWDTQNKMQVSASEVGVGISQLLPLVVASQVSNKGIIACEQPELHVHPKVQVAIGDLLTQSNSKASFLIETHSEHLILRLLRRVRETTENELPEGKSPVNPEDISVVFLSNSENGVEAKRIDVTADGDFSEDWPGGFFDERDEELF